MEFLGLFIGLATFVWLMYMGYKLYAYKLNAFNHSRNQKDKLELGQIIKAGPRVWVVTQYLEISNTYKITDLDGWNMFITVDDFKKFFKSEE